MKLLKRNVLLTGGSQGLGAAIAEHFVREGANLVFCAREPGMLKVELERVKGLATPDQKVRARPCDVSSEAQIGELVSFALAELGSLDVLVNNAGIYGPMGPTESVSLSDWRQGIEVNLFGVLLPCRAVIPHLKHKGAGKIVVISGGGATSPLPNISAYAASKAAAVRLMETLAEELKPFHIDVNAIAPGPLATRLVDEVLAAGPEKVGQVFYDKNRKWKAEGATSPDLGASLAVYLASSESDGITGKLISAQWDPWAKLHQFREELSGSDIYCLRRIVPEDRGKKFS